MGGDVILAGPCPWWADAARQARWGGREVVAWVGPELGSDPRAESRLRERAAPWIGRDQAPLLPLLDVAVVEGRPVWVYPPPDGVSAATMVRGERDSGLPGRVAIELCARIAASLERLGPDAAAWVGPELFHVLVSPGGRVALSHFAGPGPRTPARREPRGREDEVAVVWRLGVLLAELLTGQPPQPATDPSSHEASTRRLAIRLLSRSGPPLPDAVSTWLAALLAWDPVDRPALVRVAPGLDALAATLPGPDLATWTRDRVPALRSRAAPSAPPPPPPEPPEPRADDRRDHTEEIVVPDPFLDADEDTAVSAESEPSILHRSTPEQGTIPVAVGPPAEVVRRLRRTPSAALFRDPSASLTDRPAPTAPAPVSRYAALLAVAVIGFGAMGVVTAWLLWGRAP